MPWYSDMRQQLVRTVATLADLEYQQRVWIRHEMPPGVDVDSFDQAVHFIYDDTCLGDDPSEAIGWYVRDEEEATAIRRLVAELDVLFNLMGTSAPDAEYIESKQWPEIVREAKSLHEVLKKKQG